MYFLPFPALLVRRYFSTPQIVQNSLLISRKYNRNEPLCFVRFSNMTSYTVQPCVRNIRAQVRIVKRPFYFCDEKSASIRLRFQVSRFFPNDSNRWWRSSLSTRVRYSLSLKRTSNFLFSIGKARNACLNGIL